MTDYGSVLTWILLFASAIVFQWALSRARKWLKARIDTDRPSGLLLNACAGWVHRIFSIVIWCVAGIIGLQAHPATRPFAIQAVEQGTSLLRQGRDILFQPFAQIGSNGISLFTLIEVVFYVALIIILSRATYRVLLDKVLSKTPIDAGVRHAIATFAKYLVVVLGLWVGLQTAGIDLTALTVLAGALGVGLGFGLQNVANNFISGVILLFERPIKVGDRIEVDNINGRVTHIAARSTTVLTNDNISIIVPNSSFISSNVINWSHGDPKVRFRVPVGVAYGSDVNLVKRLLLEVTEENDNILQDPKPRVIFKGFGDSSLNFELRIWTSKMLHRRGVMFSEVNFAICQKFAEHHIEIPFPQRDLHFKLDAETVARFKEMAVSSAR